MVRCSQSEPHPYERSVGGLEQEVGLESLRHSTKISLPSVFDIDILASGKSSTRAYPFLAVVLLSPRDVGPEWAIILWLNVQKGADMVDSCLLQVHDVLIDARPSE
jgi:hypothetical protein